MSKSFDAFQCAAFMLESSLGDITGVKVERGVKRETYTFSTRWCKGVMPLYKGALPLHLSPSFHLSLKATDIFHPAYDFFLKADTGHTAALASERGAM